PLGGVHLRVAIPGPFHGWLALPGGLAAIHVALDVAEVKRTPAPLVELDVRLDLFIKKVVFPGRHRDDAPAARERRLLLLPAHRHSPRLPALPALLRLGAREAGAHGSHPRSLNALRGSRPACFSFSHSLKNLLFSQRRLCSAAHLLTTSSYSPASISSRATSAPRI